MTAEPLPVEGADRVLSEAEAAQLLAGYGIAYPDHRLVRSATEAVEAAEELGYPVVLKVVSCDVVHKSDVGGVVTGVTDGAGVTDAVARITGRVLGQRPDADISGYLVARHVVDGHEVIVGGIRDATFGPAVMLGMGGIYAELLNDAAFRVAPFDVAEALDMISELRAYRVLTGARGGAACDLDGLAAMIAAVSSLLAERKDIAEVDLNPVRALSSGPIALDARLIVS